MRRRNSFWPTCGLGLALSLAVLQVGEIALEAQRARPAGGGSAGESPDHRPPIDPPTNPTPSSTGATPGHPKVWLLASEVPAVRTYITMYQKAPFEAWLARLDAGVDATCAAALTCKGVDAGWMAANLALLHTIGESWVASTRSISKPAGFADFDTGAEVCALAYSYLLKTNAANRGPVGTSIKAIFDAVVDRATANKASDELHAMTGSTSGSWWYGVLPLVYDHCHDSLTPAQRTALEASISNFATAACSTLPEWPMASTRTPTVPSMPSPSRRMEGYWPAAVSLISAGSRETSSPGSRRPPERPRLLTRTRTTQSTPLPSSRMGRLSWAVRSPQLFPSLVSAAPRATASPAWRLTVHSTGRSILA